MWEIFEHEWGRKTTHETFPLAFRFLRDCGSQFSHRPVKCDSPSPGWSDPQHHSISVYQWPSTMVRDLNFLQYDGGDVRPLVDGPASWREYRFCTGNGTDNLKRDRLQMLKLQPQSYHPSSVDVSIRGRAHLESYIPPPNLCSPKEEGPLQFRQNRVTAPHDSNIPMRS